MIAVLPTKNYRIMMLCRVSSDDYAWFGFPEGRRLYQEGYRSPEDAIAGKPFSQENLPVVFCQNMSGGDLIERLSKRLS